MLLVRTYIAKSKLHGIGLFAAEPIKNGTIVWKFIPGFDIALTIKKVNKLPKITRDWVFHYGYLDKDTKEWVICVDDARFFNHSKNPNTTTPNTKGRRNELTIASRNIKKGEEITCDYFEFDDSATLKDIN